MRARCTSCAHAAGREPQVGRDLVLRAALDGDREQRLALALGQRGEPRQRALDHRPVLHDLRRTVARVARGEQLAQLLVVVARRPQRVQRRVVDDPVEPRPQRLHVVAAPQRRPRGHERLLQRVLRARLGQVAAAVAHERPPVALDDRLEGPLVAGGGERGQALVALGPQEGDGRRRHGQPDDTRHRRALRGSFPQAGSGSSSSPCSAASRTARSDSRLRSNSAGV